MTKQVPLAGFDAGWIVCSGLVRTGAHCCGTSQRPVLSCRFFITGQQGMALPECP
jgi:hypothetical protein